MAKSTRAEPQVTLNMMGAACPGPMLGAKRVLDELRAGEVMLLVSDCPSTRDDLFSWPKYADVEIVRTEKLPQGGTGYYIRKGKARHVSPHAVLDVRGATCPGPVIEAKKLLNGMREGEVLQLVSDCPGIWADVHSWAKATGLELADARETAPGEYVFHICKR
jgi:tRNA 2-thiouridine synthesizing protein A